MSDKMPIRLEYEDDGLLKSVRPHRQFFGPPIKIKPILIELEYEDDQPIFGCLDVDESEGTPGRSSRCEIKGLVITADPHLFGNDIDRLADGKKPFIKLDWGTWNPLNLTDL